MKIIICLVLFSLYLVIAQKETSVVLLRHAEKALRGNNLSCKGLNRALLLPDLLVQKFGYFQVAYIPRPITGHVTERIRMLQTVTPTAVKYNLTINSAFKERDVLDVAQDILEFSLVLVVWELHSLGNLTRALGVPTGIEWNPLDFDSIWFVRHAGTNSADLLILSQGLNNVSSKC